MSRGPPPIILRAATENQKAHFFSAGLVTNPVLIYDESWA